MPKQGQTVLQANRAVKQETLREYLSERGKLNYILDNLHKIECLDPECESFANSLAKYKEANTQRLKLLAYYLPTLKGVEITGEGGGQLVVNLKEYKE
ncbi:MAG: hypothetical protein GY829_12440 [Gammaproteobacteria bacterium]|nr:hypothetical protein [Gammaproteobacteria bacterium]